MFIIKFSLLIAINLQFGLQSLFVSIVVYKKNRTRSTKILNVFILIAVIGVLMRLLETS